MHAERRNVGLQAKGIMMAEPQAIIEYPSGSVTVQFKDSWVRNREALQLDSLFDDPDRLEATTFLRYPSKTGDGSMYEATFDIPVHLIRKKTLETVSMGGWWRFTNYKAKKVGSDSNRFSFMGRVWSPAIQKLENELIPVIYEWFESEDRIKFQFDYIAEQIRANKQKHLGNVEYAERVLSESSKKLVHIDAIERAFQKQGMEGIHEYDAR